MGSAAAWWLGRAGRSVLLLERHEVGHARGSSHGASRVFRFSYRDPKYVQMAMDARQLWRQAEAEADTTLLLTLGGIDFGEGTEQNQRALATCGASYELVDGAEAMRRYPRITLPPAVPALLQPDYGVILAERSVRTFVDLAVARGAELREGAGVSELSVGDRAASVVAAGERHRSAVVVLAAGPWTRDVAGRAGIDVPVTPSRETVSYYRLPDEFSLPILVEWGPHPFYALPDPGSGVKAGGHHLGPTANPDEPGDVDPETIAAERDWVRRHYRDAEPEPWRAETCLYTNTDDESFVLERNGPVVIGSACSGHGFKFAPLIGKRLAELAAS
jgi:sarcosine oxidase